MKHPLTHSILLKDGCNKYKIIQQVHNSTKRFDPLCVPKRRGYNI